MKKGKSIRVKITLWFTFSMIVLSIFIGAIFFSMFTSVNTKEQKNYLINRVDETTDEIKEDRMISERISDNDDIDDILKQWFYDEDIMYFIYDEDGNYISGFYSEDISSEISLDNEKLQEVTINNKEYYIYDDYVTMKHGSGYWIRGLYEKESVLPSISSGEKLIFVIIIILIVVSASGGYFITSRLLKPIKKISNTTKEIRESGDLTKRIPLNGNKDELHELANGINKMFDTLEENFESEKQFASNASHELRTPVSVILAQCEYALDDPIEKEELWDLVKSIQKQGFKMQKLIETLLIFTRMEQGTEKYPKDRYNISAITSELCEEYKLIDEKNITLFTTVNPNIYMNINSELYEIMVRNLLQNAYRYSEKGSEITVKLNITEGKITLSVSDHGKGMSSDEIQHIFERFYRGDTARHSKGLGLGLSLVKEIAAYHNGKITVSSKEKEGSTFKISFF